MLKKPKNYEEAKLILKNSATDDYQKKILKVTRLRTIIMSALAAAGLTTLQISFNNPALTAVCVPAAILSLLPHMIPYFLQKKLIRELKSGRFFEDRTDDEIIKIAEDYTDSYNQFEDNRDNIKEGKSL